MLTYEALIDQARLRGMPLSKARGILREYLQVLILKEIYKLEEGRKLYFTGGTYLRLTCDLKRFSEDLDFNTAKLKRPAFESLCIKAASELKRLNIGAHVKFNHWDNILSARLIFPGIEKAYNIVSPFSKEEGIVIKLEANKPRWNIKAESQVIAGFGEICPCICTEKSALFADKVDALVKKSRGRHIYDVIFMLSNKFPVNKHILRTFGYKDTPAQIIEKRIKSFSAAELKKQAEGLRLFLFDESQAGLVVRAKEVIPALLAKYKS